MKKKHQMGIKFSGKLFDHKKDFKSLNLFKDTDRDGRMNLLDCNPFNKNQLGVEPSTATRERLEKVPLFVTERKIREEVSAEEEPHTYHIMSKEARKKAPTARKRLLSIIKKYPETLGEIERQKPEEVVYSTKEKSRRGGMRVRGILGEAHKGMYPADKPTQPGLHRAYIYGGGSGVTESDVKSKARYLKKVRKILEEQGDSDRTIERKMKKYGQYPEESLPVSYTHLRAHET